MSPELQEARAASQGLFDQQVLTDQFYNSSVPRKRLDELVRIMETDPVFQDRHKYKEYSRPDQFRYAFKVCARLLEIAQQQSWSNADQLVAGGSILGEFFPTTLHNSAFKYVIEVIGSDTQGAQWLSRCDTHEVIGCYAQTELGHGSNVRGLQTSAYYDPATKKFLLFSNDPLTARKWWIGGLGIVADHAAVQASLYFPPKNDPLSTDRSKYEYLGPHMFIVPIRDPVSREPLPGVTVGDIGPKAANGFSLSDNGYLALDAVSIPVDYMLNRFTSVDTSDPKGAKYVLTGNPKVMYASMTNLRAGYPMTLGFPLAKAVTIASRYLTIRRQFQDPGNKADRRELQVVKYSSVYTRLVPYVALAHSTGFILDAVQASFSSMLKELVDNGNDALLPEVHAITSSIKGVISIHFTRAIEQCQILMGGHGFSYHSGLATLYGNALPSQTFEGENYVVAQQTATALAKAYGFILKNGKDAARRRLFPAAKFLVSSIDEAGLDSIRDGPGSTKGVVSPKTVDEWLSSDAYIIKLFELRTTSLVAELVAATKTTAPKDIPHTAAAVSMAFGEQYIVTQYLRGAARISDAATRVTTLRLAHITAFSFLVRDGAAALALVEAGHLHSHSLRPLREALHAEIVAAAPHVVALTDAFGISDFELNSALGCYDGHPYERLVERAAQSTLNGTSFAAEIAELKRAGLAKPLSKL